MNLTHHYGLINPIVTLTGLWPSASWGFWIVGAALAANIPERKT